MDGDLNKVLFLLDRALGEMEAGFVRCETCGSQEDTKDLDFTDDIKSAKEEVMIILGNKHG